MYYIYTLNHSFARIYIRELNIGRHIHLRIKYGFNIKCETNHKKRSALEYGKIRKLFNTHDLRGFCRLSLPDFFKGFIVRKFTPFFFAVL